MQPKPKLRFAPSPNGFMHVGHAYSALLNVEVARLLRADFIIRMEDIDQLRCTKAYQTACLEDLAAIGVTSDEKIMYQSQRQNAYDAALDKLSKLGVLYPCLATRGDIKRHYENHELRHDPDGGLIYPDLYKNLSLSDQRTILDGETPFALRLNMLKSMEIIGGMGDEISFSAIDLDNEKILNKDIDPNCWGDVVLSRKDIGTSYHLSVVVDDAAQGITHIIRGIDLFHATSIHRVLQLLLQLPEPVYFHHQLIVDDDMKKLAKSAKSQPLREILTLESGLDFILDLHKATGMPKMTQKLVMIMGEKNGQKIEK